MCQLFIAVGISGAARRYIIVDRYNSKGTGQQVSRLIAALVFRGVLGKAGLAFSEKKYEFPSSDEPVWGQHSYVNWRRSIDFYTYAPWRKTNQVYNSLAY